MSPGLKTCTDFLLIVFPRLLISVREKTIKMIHRLNSEKIWPHYMFLGGHFCHLANSHPRSGILKVLEAFFTLVLSGLARQVVKIRVCLLDY